MMMSSIDCHKYGNRKRLYRDQVIEIVCRHLFEKPCGRSGRERERWNTTVEKTRHRIRPKHGLVGPLASLPFRLFV